MLGASSFPVNCESNQKVAKNQWDKNGGKKSCHPSPPLSSPGSAGGFCLPSSPSRGKMWAVGGVHIDTG